MRNWMNSLGATPRVKYIYEDLKDSLALIQVILKPEIHFLVLPSICDSVWQFVIFANLLCNARRHNLISSAYKSSVSIYSDIAASAARALARAQPGLFCFGISG